MLVGIIAAIVAFAVAWAGAGGVDYHSGASSQPSGQEPDKCEFCRRVDAWWARLGWWGKVKGGAWYAAQKAGCALKGC
jgi:hypothetical protein